jgi:anion-transporting  ArsA/GET3 family ATPase
MSPRSEERTKSNSFFTDCKILICVGGGGVGKTTMAAALGVLAAQSGLKTLVLTIDPSLRLAQILGIEGCSDISLVPGQSYPGTLKASVVNHKAVFDSFVRRASTSPEVVDRIQNNRLYQQLSTTLSGSQEFTALESLYQSHTSGLYDLIILDTPPAQHAIDFLQAPQKLAALFSEGVAKWFRKPEAGRTGIVAKLLNSGTRQALKILEMLTGADFIRELSDFFMIIENWQSKLHDRTVEFQRLLVSPTTHFALVTSFEEAKLSEAQVFSQEITKSGYHLKRVFLNRAFPNWHLDALQIKAGNEKVVTEIKRLFFEWKLFYDLRQKLFELFSQKLPSGVQTYRVAEFIMPISDLNGLEKMALRIQEDS